MKEVYNNIDLVLGKPVKICDDFLEKQEIAALEEKDRKQYIEDIVSLMEEFTYHGISTDIAAQLAAAFYNDPIIRKRRAQRRKRSESKR